MFGEKKYNIANKSIFDKNEIEKYINIFFYLWI